MKSNFAPSALVAFAAAPDLAELSKSPAARASPRAGRELILGTADRRA